jgi:hypothetical protein
MRKYSKLRKLLRESTISTHPGEVLIQCTDANREKLFELLMDVIEEDEQHENEAASIIERMKSKTNDA